MNQITKVQQPTKEIRLLGWHHPVIDEEEELKKDEELYKVLIIEDNRQEVIKKLNSLFSQGFKYNIARLIPLEVKQWFKNNELEGKKYNYVYVKPVHTRVLTYTRDEVDAYNNGFVGECLYKIQKSKKAVEYLMKNLKNYESHLNNEVRIRQCLNTTSKEKTDTHYIRIREKERNFNYQLSTINKYNHIFFKKYDKKTKKTSLKGLKATIYHVNFIGSSRDTHARFDTYLSVDDLKAFCRQNGMKWSSKETYYYGDYADWILKTLV